jgi:hypothetical protein
VLLGSVVENREREESPGQRPYNTHAATMHAKSVGEPRLVAATFDQAYGRWPNTTTMCGYKGIVTLIFSRSFERAEQGNGSERQLEDNGVDNWVDKRVCGQGVKTVAKMGWQRGMIWGDGMKKGVQDSCWWAILQAIQR